MVYKLEAIPVTQFFINERSLPKEASMLLKVLSLLALATILSAAPAKDDLTAAEGRHVPAYAPAPSAYAPQPSYAHAPSGYGAAPKYGSATVTSYNRRGSYAQASEYAKPAIYGSSYGASHPSGPSYSHQPSAYPAPAPAPAPAYSSHQPSPYAAPAPAYSGYGPQTNAYSAHSQQQSHDPEYDAAKDPVSQYAAYVPVREYGAKAHSNGNELSIYGYRK